MKKQYSLIVQGTWSLQSTAVLRISPYQKLAVKLEATCSWQERTESPSTMGLSSTSHKFRSGGRIECTFHQCKNCCFNATNTNQTWSPAATARTPMQTDNTTTHALLTINNLPKALKAMDMRFHWVRCGNAQGQFRYYWRPGTQNLAYYFTKHHPATHHKTVPTILTAVDNPEYRKLFLTHTQRTGKSGETGGKEKAQTTMIHGTPTTTTVTTKSFVKHLLLTPKF